MLSCLYQKRFKSIILILLGLIVHIQPLLAQTKSNKSEPLIQQITDSAFLGFPSQIYFLAYICGSLLALVLFLYKTLWSSDQKKIDQAILIGNENAKQINSLIALHTGLATRIQGLEGKPSVSDHESRNIAREEIHKFHEMIDRMVGRKT